MLMNLLAAGATIDHTSEWLTFAGVAVTAILGAVATILVSITRRENSEQHAASVDALNIVASEVRGVGTKIDTHLGWHAGMLMGPRGLTGDTGQRGDIGPRGDTGDTGDTGGTGVQGETGEAGVQGDAGPAGADGHDSLFVHIEASKTEDTPSDKVLP